LLNCFNWRKRPLPAKVQRYAAADVEFLDRLYQAMQARLDQSEWAEPHAEQCAWLLQTTRHTPTPFDEHDWRKLKGADRLDPEQAAVVHALFVWRHQLCTHINRAAFFILPDKALVAIGKTAPRTPEDLSQCGVPASTVARRGHEILALVDGAATAPPKPPRRHRGNPGRRLDKDQVAAFNALREWRSDVAAYYTLPSDLIASNSVLKDVVRLWPERVTDLTEVPDLLDWQIERFGGAMLDVLALLSQ